MQVIRWNNESRPPVAALTDAVVEVPASPAAVRAAFESALP